MPHLGQEKKIFNYLMFIKNILLIHIQELNRVTDETSFQVQYRTEMVVLYNPAQITQIGSFAVIYNEVIANVLLRLSTHSNMYLT